MSGVKNDGAKPRMDLLDGFAMTQVAEVLTFGANKYAAHNWRGGIATSRLYAAAQRHLVAFNNGENTDAESGLPHLAHAACCLMFLQWTTAHKPEFDDRYDPTAPAAELGKVILTDENFQPLEPFVLTEDEPCRRSPSP